MSATVDELRGLADAPFELLRALEARLQRARLDNVAGRADRWTGLALRVAGRDCIAPQREIREVVVRPELTRVPNAKPWLQGLANVRGSLLTVIDPAAMLDLAPVPPTRATRVAVLNSDRHAVGFVVDDVFGYRAFESHEQVPVEAMPAEDPLAECRLGAFHRDGRPWTVFSFHKLMQLPVARQASW